MKPFFFKVIVFLLLSMLVPVKEGKTQYLSNNPSFGERIFYGGGLGLRIGDYTNITVNPMVGYRISNRWSAGVIGNYIYISSKTFNYSYSLYGGSIFSSYNIFKNIDEFIPFLSPNSSILLYGEYNLLNVEDYFKDHHSDVKQSWIHTPLLGLAYQSQIGARSYFILSVLFNFNETRYSPYSNPVVRLSLQL